MPPRRWRRELAVTTGPYRTDMNALIDNDLRLDDPVVRGPLTLFPIVGEAPAAPAYLTGPRAEALGALRVAELDGAAAVPELVVHNGGAVPVLLVEGETVIGNKQNRTLNLSVLVAAGADTAIPVSCVEAGRWRARSRAFTAAPRTQYAAGRAKRMAQVTACVRRVDVRPGRCGPISPRSRRASASALCTAAADVTCGLSDRRSAAPHWRQTGRWSTCQRFICEMDAGLAAVGRARPRTLVEAGFSSARSGEAGFSWPVKSI